MGTGEGKTAGNLGGNDDQLAKDVARLYSWANVEGVPYRDFSRQRALHNRQSLPPEEVRKIEIVTSPDKGGSVEQSTSIPVVDDVPPQRPVVSIPADCTSTGQSSISSVRNSTSLRAEPAPPLVTPGDQPWPWFTERLAPDSGGQRPVLAVYSFAGGVGKTTISANLARVLCFQGEEVLLVDASGSGLLPFYFGANDLRPGLRTFVAPGNKCSPLRVIGADEVTAAWLENNVRAAIASSQRTIFDLGPASFSLLPQIFGMCTEILIPILPDPNSILSVSRIEKLLDKLRSAGTKTPLPYYVFNQFDNQHPVDLNARELASRQCGERLLPLTVCHGAEIAEAIASRMTVADYAPESEVTHDFVELALWLEKIAPVNQRKSAGRWIEQ